MSLLWEKMVKEINSLRGVPTDLKGCVDSAGVFEIQNIWEYVNNQITGDDPNKTWKFPKLDLFLPYEDTWFEWVEKQRYQGKPCNVRMGAFTKISEDRAYMMMAFFVETWDGDIYCLNEGIFYKEDDVWQFCAMAETDPVWTTAFGSMQFPHETSYAQRKEVVDQFSKRSMYLILITLLFLGCKNVVTVEHKIDDKLRKAKIKRGKLVIEKHYTLAIDVMKKTLRDEGGSEKTGIIHAFHLCRGHFKTYTEDKPLLGRAVGTFFFSAHARGSKEHGSIKKDYRVKM